MAVREKPKALSSEDIAEILKLKRSDITATKLKQLFANINGHPARFNPSDKFTLVPKAFYNKEAVPTTIGRYIYNMFCMPISYLNTFGYCNETLDEDTIGKLENKMGKMILEDTMTTKEYAEFMDNSEWLGMSLSYYLSPSLSNNIIVPLPAVMKRKDELFTQYQSEIESGDINAANKIEKELLGMAKAEMEKIDDPAYDCFKSGVFKFPVAYKKCSIMVGAVSDPNDGKLRILKSNYVNGISENEYDKTAILTVLGGISRGVYTQKYGYESKKYNAGLQNVSIDIGNTLDLDSQDIELGKKNDCGTQKYLTITIPEPLKSMFYYRYAIEGSELVEITPDNIDKFVGREIKLRSPMYCKGDQICEHCAGSLFRRMDFDNAGLLASNMTGNLLNLSMKAMHDSTVKITKIDVEKFITERN